MTRLLILAALVGCSGDIGSATDGPDVPQPNLGPGDRPEPGAEPLPQFHFPADGEDIRPGLRRLTARQLEAAFEQVTGQAVDFSDLPGATPLLNLENDASRLMIADAMTMQTLLRAATEASAEADIDARFPCEGACSDDELRAFLARTFVHPVDGAMLARYRETYDGAQARVDDAFARRAVMMAALVSPRFLYRTEIGEGGELTPHELAEKLSYALWGAPPDPALVDAAFDGSLTDDAVYEAQVDRLLEDGRFEGRIRDFVFDWLGLDHVDFESVGGGEALPLESAMIEEVEALLRDHFFEARTGLVGALLSEHTFIGRDLADFYGLEGGGDAPERVELGEGSHRRGLLTTALVLAAHGKVNGRSPMQRGEFLVDDLLCYGFPADAGEAAMSLPADGGDRTFREQFAQLEQIPNCVKCHRMLNAGFAFDIFDNVGRLHDVDRVDPSEAAGSFELRPFDVLTFESTRDAVGQLANHPELGRCFSAQLLRYAQGTIPSTDDARLLEALRASYDET
ncbi:MAG: DUF1592 domain-containing protein, partial [Myxococcota bacterium]